MRRRPIAVLMVVSACVAALTIPAGAETQASGRSGPARGGSVTFALEAETALGFCLASAQLAASGIQVVNAIYDTLTTLNSDGEYVPYLAQSVEPNETFTEWTITVREGVRFHDDTPLDAAAVKLNLDAYRGANPAIDAPLGSFIFSDIDTIEVTGPLTVLVTTKRPWPAFPAFLYGTGRYAMMAPAQLANPDTCPTNMIGTGPFRLVEWRPNESLTVRRNNDFWRPGLPYLDEIVFRPVVEGQQRVNGLASGDFDIMHTSGALQIIDLRKRERDGQVNLIDSDRGAEVGYGMLNVSKPPFDDITARKAVALAGDGNELNEIRNRGLLTLASGPFPPGSPAYLEEVGLPDHNLKKARKLAAKYEREHGEPISYEYLTTNEPENRALAELSKQQQAEAGIEVSIRQIDQSTLISTAISGQFQQLAFRNHPGGDPDTQYVWWHSGSPVNFGRIDDPVVDDLLERGRVETDPDARVQIYRQLNRRFASQLYNLWVWYTRWGVASQPSVKGVAGPPLPDDHGRPFALFAGIIPVAGLSLTE